MTEVFGDIRTREDLKTEIRLLRDALYKMVKEVERLRAPLMFKYPWGVRVATGLKKKYDPNTEDPGQEAP